MKKTINWTLLLLVIVISLTLVACGGGGTTNTNETTEPNNTTGAPADPHSHCACGGDAVGLGEHTTCTNVEWQPWPGAENAVAGGHYYLTEDVTGDFITTETGRNSFALCLNGHNITANKKMVVSGNIIFCDCTETEGTLTSMENDAEGVEGGIGHLMGGGSVTIYGGNYKLGGAKPVRRAACWLVYDDAKLIVYGGTLYGGYATESGGNIYLRSNGELYMYGGSLIQTGDQKHAVRGANIYTDGGNIYLKGDVFISGGIAEHGGNIYMQGGVCEMTGGVITNGKTNGTGNGGNVYTKGTVLFSGGEITNGLASRGGNVFLHSTGAMEMSGTAKIENGSAVGIREAGKNVGGNVYVYESASSYLKLTGGEIIGGTADLGTNIFIAGQDCQVYFDGGKVSGGTVRMDDETGNAKVIFNGSAVEATVEMGRGIWTIKKVAAPLTLKVLNDITPNTLKLNLAEVAADCADITIDAAKAGANEIVFYTDAATVPACLKAPAGYTLATETTNAATTFKVVLKK